MTNDLKIAVAEALGVAKNFRAEFELINTQILEASKNARGIGGSNATPRDTSERVKKNAKEVNYLNESLKQEKKIEEDLIKILVKKEKTLTDTAKQIAKQRVETQILTKVNKQEGIASSRLTTEYEKQSANLAILRREYKDLAIRQELHTDLTKEEVVEMKKLEKEANKIDLALKKVDKSVGQSTRGVGEYERGIGKLRQGWGQLTSLMAAFGVSVGVSLFIDLAKEANELAKTLEGRSRRANIVFGDSLNFVTKQAEENAKIIGTTRSEYIGATASVADLLVPLGFQRKLSAELATEVVNLSGALSDWVGGQYSSVEVSEILQKAVLGETEQLKQLGIVIDQSSKDFNTRIKQLEIEENLTREQARALDILNQITTKSLDAQNSFSKGAASISAQQASANAELRENEELLATSLSPTIVKATEVYSQFTEGVSIIVTKISEQETGMGKLWEAFNILNPVAGLYREVTGNQIKTLEQLKQPREEHTKQLLEEAKAYIALNGSIGPLTKAQEDENQKRLDNILFVEEEIKKKSSLKDINLEISKLQESLNDVNNREDAKIIQEEIRLLEEKRKAILGSEDTFLIEGSTAAFGKQISKLEELRDTTALTADEYEEFTQKIADLEFEVSLLDGTYETFLTKLDKPLETPNLEDLFNPQERLSLFDGDIDADLELEAELERIDKIAEANKELFNTKKELYRELQDLAINSINSIFEAELNRYDESIDENQEYYDNLLENENLTDKEREDLEDQRDKRETELERKKKATEKKAFLFGQAFALGEIAIDTAKSVAKIKAQAAILAANPITAPLASIALSQIPFVIGTGAAAAASVVATSVPQFKDGHLEGTYSGDAIINDERGSVFKEIVLRNSGKMETFEGRNKKISMNRGDKVIPASLSEEILNKGIALSYLQQQDKIAQQQIKIIEKPIDKEVLSVLKTISNKKMYSTPPSAQEIGRQTAKAFAIENRVSKR